jgi:hypothetical protein
MTTEVTKNELQKRLEEIEADMAEMNRVKVDAEGLSELTGLAGQIVPSDIDETIRILLDSEQFKSLKNPGAIVAMIVQMDEVIIALATEIARLRK